MDKQAFLMGYQVGRRMRTWREKTEDNADFLRATGAQWVDTEYIATPDTRFLITANLEPYFALSATFLFGSRSGFPVADMFDLSVAGAGVGDVVLQSGRVYGRTWVGNEIYNRKVIYDCNRYGMKMYAENMAPLGKISLQGAAPTNSASSVYLLTLRGWGRECSCKGALYRFKIYEGDSLTRDFIPRRDSAGVGYLLEMTQGKKYYSIGPGQFEYGRDEA